jgi:hypothetical protein
VICALVYRLLRKAIWVVGFVLWVACMFGLVVALVATEDLKIGRH